MAKHALSTRSANNVGNLSQKQKLSVNNGTNCSGNQQKISVNVVAAVNDSITASSLTSLSGASQLASLIPSGSECVLRKDSAETALTMIATPVLSAEQAQQEEFLKFRNELGSTTTVANEKRAVQRFVRETLFAKLKFISCDSELEYSGMFRLIGFVC